MMSTELFLFYLFSTCALISALLVINLTNAVHSVLFLILVFCNVAGLLLVSGAEFLAFMLLIVYVGAIAVLFLFVVMMLNIKFGSFRANKWSILPLSITIFFSFLLQFASMSSFSENSGNVTKNVYLIWNNWIIENNDLQNVEVIGGVLYTKYSFVFLASGFILLIAMIGAIVLTMHQKSNVKKQLVDIQLNRNPSGALKFVSIRK